MSIADTQTDNAPARHVPDRLHGRGHRWLKSWESLLIAVAIAIFVVNSFASPYFLDAWNLSDATFNFTEKALIAFAMATIFAAVSGVLYVHFIRYSYPSSWSLKLSLDFLAMIVIGGLRSIYGTVLGAFIVFAVPDMFLKQIPYFNQISYSLNGLLIILVIMFYPNGLVYIFKDIRNVWRKVIGKGKVKHVVRK